MLINYQLIIQLLKYYSIIDYLYLEKKSFTCFKFIQMTWPKNCLVYSPHTHSFMYSYYKDVTCLKLYSILLSSQTSRPTTRRSLMVEANLIHIPDRETAESAAATFCLGSCGNGGIKNGLVSSCCIHTV